MISPMFAGMQGWQLVLSLTFITILLTADYIVRGLVIARIAGYEKVDSWRIWIPFCYVDFRKTIAVGRAASAHLQILRPDLFLLFLATTCLILESNNALAMVAFFCSMSVYYLLAVILSYRRILRDHYRITNITFSLLQITPLIGSALILYILSRTSRKAIPITPISITPLAPPSASETVNILPEGLMDSNALLEHLAKAVLQDYVQEVEEYENDMDYDTEYGEESILSDSVQLSADYDFFDQMLGDGEVIRLEELGLQSEPIIEELPVYESGNESEPTDDEISIDYYPEEETVDDSPNPLDYYTNPIFPPRSRKPAPVAAASANDAIPDHVLLDALGYLPEDV